MSTAVPQCRREATSASWWETAIHSTVPWIISWIPSRTFPIWPSRCRWSDPDFDEIYLHGFLGGRRDHELLNLGEAYHFLDGRGEPAHLLHGPCRRGIQRRQLGVSLPTDCSAWWCSLPARLTLSGQCRYPIAPDTLVKPVSSLGLSNQGHRRNPLGDGWSRFHLSKQR